MKGFVVVISGEEDLVSLLYYINYGIIMFLLLDVGFDIVVIGMICIFVIENFQYFCQGYNCYKLDMWVFLNIDNYGILNLKDNRDYLVLLIYYIYEEFEVQSGEVFYLRLYGFREIMLNLISFFGYFKFFNYGIYVEDVNVYFSKGCYGF